MTADTLPTGLTRGADGIKRCVRRDSSCVAMLRRVVDSDGDSSALVGADGRQLTYAQLWDAATRVAGGLLAQGVTRGDRVMIALPNSVHWCLGFFGTLLAGAVAVPINTRLTQNERHRIEQDCAPAAVMNRPTDLTDGPPSAVEDLTEDEPAALFYTSGTTGRSKGVRTTHANLIANTENARRVLRVDEDERVCNLIAAPLAHVTGCNSQLLTTCHVGGTSVVVEGANPAQLLRYIKDYGITMLMGAPTMYAMMLRARTLRSAATATVKSVSFGGAPVDPSLVSQLREVFADARLGNGYGLTEAASFVTYLPDAQVTQRVTTVGPAVPLVDVAIARNGSRVGEILVRGPNVAAGYWGDPFETARTFTDGWLRTGDLGFITSDGYVTLVDRLKDVINRAGDNVYSLEVERAFATHPAVAEVAVVGLPDPLIGERVAVAVVLADPSVEIRDVFRHARTSLAGYKLPELLQVRTDPLPRNASGKVVKGGIKSVGEWSPAPRSVINTSSSSGAKGRT